MDIKDKILLTNAMRRSNENADDDLEETLAKQKIEIMSANLEILATEEEYRRCKLTRYERENIVKISKENIDEITKYLLANKIRLNGINALLLLMFKLKRKIITFEMFVDVLELLNINDTKLVDKCEKLLDSIK